MFPHGTTQPRKMSRQGDATVCMANGLPSPLSDSTPAGCRWTVVAQIYEPSPRNTEHCHSPLHLAAALTNEIGGKTCRQAGVQVPASAGSAPVRLITTCPGHLGFSVTKINGMEIAIRSQPKVPQHVPSRLLTRVIHNHRERAKSKRLVVLGPSTSKSTSNGLNESRHSLFRGSRSGKRMPISASPTMTRSYAIGSKTRSVSTENEKSGSDAGNERMTGSSNCECK